LHSQSQSEMIGIRSCTDMPLSAIQHRLTDIDRWLVGWLFGGFVN